MAECDAQSLQIGLGHIGQALEIDGILGKDRRVLREPDRLEPNRYPVIEAHCRTLTSVCLREQKRCKGNVAPAPLRFGEFIKLRRKLFLLFSAIDLLLRAVLRGRSDAQGQSQPLDRKDGKVGRRRKVRGLGFESHFQKSPGGRIAQRVENRDRCNPG